MKKLLSFLLIMCVLVSTFVLKDETSDIFCFENCQKVCFVSEKDFGFDTQYSGDKIFNFCSYEKAKEIYAEVKDAVEGIQFYFKEFDSENFLKRFNASTISKSEIEGIEIICGYTPCFEKVIFADGKKTNFQLAKTDDWTILGFPIILTSY